MPPRFFGYDVCKCGLWCTIWVCRDAMEVVQKGLVSKESCEFGRVSCCG